jgi:hypothetical protein
MPCGGVALLFTLVISFKPMLVHSGLLFLPLLLTGGGLVGVSPRTLTLSLKLVRLCCLSGCGSVRLAELLKVPLVDGSTLSTAVTCNVFERVRELLPSLITDKLLLPDEDDEGGLKSLSDCGGGCGAGCSTCEGGGLSGVGVLSLYSELLIVSFSKSTKSTKLLGLSRSLCRMLDWSMTVTGFSATIVTRLLRRLFLRVVRESATRLSFWKFAAFSFSM